MSVQARYLLIITLSSFLCTTQGSSVQAQFGRSGGGPPGGGTMGGPQSGVGRVLLWEGLGDELQLSEEQKNQIQSIIQAATPDQQTMMGIMMQMREASDEERDTLRAQLQEQAQAKAKEVEAQLQKTLTAEQFNRIKQISRQQSGIRGVVEDETAATLKLTDDQKAKIETILNPPGEDRSSFFRMSEEDREKRRLETETAVLAVLSPEQQKSWQDLQGSPVKGLDSLRGRRGERGGDRRREERTEAPTETPPALTQTTPAPESSAPATMTPPAAGEVDPLDSFLDQVEQMPAEQAPSGPAVIDFGQLADATVGPEGGKTVTFNFQYAPWEEVLKLFARIAGLTLDMTSTPPGTFTYFDKSAHTPEQALDVLNGYLLQRGYLLVRRDQFLIVANISQGIPPNLVPTVEVAELASRGRNELVRTVFTLDQLRAADVVNDVKSLLGPQGSVTAMGTTNRLVVTGLAQNLLRVQMLLEGTSPTAGPNEVAFRAFPLQHIPAVDAEPTIKALLGVTTGFSDQSSGGRSSRSSDPRAMFMEMMQRRMSGGDDRGGSRGGGDSASSATGTASQARITIDARTNSLLVAARPAELLIVEQALKQIDLPARDGTTGFKTASGPILKVYEIPDGDLGKISQTLMAMVPGVMINEDDRADVLHVIGTEAKQREVAQLIGLLDGTGGGSEIALIPLFNLDPEWTATALNNMFLNEGTTAPVVQVDQYGQNLVVRGTSDHLLQVKALVLQMSQTAGTSGSIPGVNSGPIRQIPLQGQDPAELLPMLERLWRTSQRSPLRIVRPGESLESNGSSQPQNKPPQTPAQPTSSERTSGDNNEVQRQQPDSQKTSQHLLHALTTGTFPVMWQEESLPAQPAPADSESSAAPQDSGVVITVIGDRLVISGQNEQELDALQRLLNSLMSQMASRTQWTIFYLRVAEASATAEMLRQLFPDIEVAASTTSGSALSRLGQMTGSTPAPASTVPAVRIVPESRSNALFVSGPADRVRELEQVIKLLDSSELPESFRDRSAHTIQVQYASVEEVAKILSDVYADLLPQRTPARGGRPGEEDSSSLTAGELTIGIDAQTSQIIVSCNENLFRQIEELVQSLDESARQAKRTVRVVNLEYADAAAVQTTLGTLLPKVTFSTSSSSSSRVSSSRTPSQTPSGSDNQGGSSSGGSSDDSRRRFFEDMMRRRSEGGGSPFGGRNFSGSSNRGRGR